MVVDPFKALEPDAPVLRTDKKDKKDNHIWHWEAGDRAGDRAGASPRPTSTVKQDIYIPRIHVASIETCGCVADFDKVDGQAHGLHDHAGAARDPHGVRAGGRARRALGGARSASSRPTSAAASAARCRSIPGYVIAVAASVLIGKPVKWIEDRMENLQADSFARDYHIDRRAGGEEGRHDHRRCASRRSPTTATPTRPPTRRSSRPACSRICTGSYDIKHAFAEVDGVYTNKPPGGVAYRCSFRVTEAVHAIERMVDVLAHELEMDPAELRMKNFIPPEQFPYKSALGWEYDSGNYAGRAAEGDGQDRLRRRCARSRRRSARAAS